MGVKFFFFFFIATIRQTNPLSKMLKYLIIDALKGMSQRNIFKQKNLFSGWEESWLEVMRQKPRDENSVMISFFYSACRKISAGCWCTFNLC